MDLKSWPCWAKVVIAVGLTVFVFNFPNSSGDWAAWIQAVASVAAIVWAGHQGIALLKHQKKMQQKAAVELAFSALRSIHTHLYEVGKTRWWPGEKLRKVAEGHNFFRVEYLDPIESIFDQINLEYLGDAAAVDILVRARSKIWRLRELLTWIIVEVEKAQEYEKNGRARFEEQADSIKGVVDELHSCLSELSVYVNKHEAIPVFES